MRADTVFSSFGPAQAFNGIGWVDVGQGTLGNQVVAFPFVPTTTVSLSSVDVALAQVGLASPLVVSIASNSGGIPGTVIDSLSQVGSFSTNPTVVSFTCGASCSMLQGGSTYWLIAQQSNPSALSTLFFSTADTGTWYYDENGSTAGPWTVATLTPSIGAFDVNGTATSQSPVPEPSSLVLLGSGMLAVLAKARGRFARQG